MCLILAGICKYGISSIQVNIKSLSGTQIGLFYIDKNPLKPIYVGIAMKIGKYGKHNIEKIKNEI
jgi:hypothetical protein